MVGAWPQKKKAARTIVAVDAVCHSLFPYYADSVRALIPSIVDLQERATAGHFSKMAGKKLHYLNAGEVHTEVVKRDVRRVHANHQTVQLQTLKDLLRGVQHVPALLAKTPCVSPNTHVADKIHQITETTLNPNHSRVCDWRKAIILVAKELEDERRLCLRNIKRMVQLLGEVTGILYARAAHHTPGMVQHLSLALWRNYCYLQELFQSLKTVTLGALCGGYFHIVLHSPLQLMLVSLRSTNTENLERLQGTASRIGETVTSRRASEVPRNVLLWCQAELEGECIKP